MNRLPRILCISQLPGVWSVYVTGDEESNVSEAEMLPIIIENANFADSMPIIRGELSISGITTRISCLEMVKPRPEIDFNVLAT